MYIKQKKSKISNIIPDGKEGIADGSYQHAELLVFHLEPRKQPANGAVFICELAHARRQKTAHVFETVRKLFPVAASQ